MCSLRTIAIKCVQKTLPLERVAVAVVVALLTIAAIRALRTIIDDSRARERLALILSGASGSVARGATPAQTAFGVAVALLVSTGATRAARSPLGTR